ncbi:MAG: glycosyltransferase family 2 protein [Chitinophagaceae bacterium]
MESVSVVVITFNEERHIARCLESVKKVADEIVVLDSFSTDRTVDIARSFGATVYQEEFAGYVSQKNRALEFAKNNYVLCLDADEALSAELVGSILIAKRGLGLRAYKMSRKAFYCGKFIRHGSWYPEPKLRLFDKRVLHWGGLDPHDRVIAPASMRVGTLSGDLLHYICETVGEHKIRSENFSGIAAESLYKQGQKTNWVKIIGSPTWFFFTDYFVRCGFLSGWRGWRIATIQTRYHYAKYRKLLRLWLGGGKLN